MELVDQSFSSDYVSAMPFDNSAAEREGNVSSLKSMGVAFDGGSKGKSFKWIPCRYFKEGIPNSCRQGATCPFAHGQEQLVPKPDPSMMAHTSMVNGEMRGVKRTAKAANLPIMCFHHLRGTCEKGDECQFYHDEEKFRKAMPPTYKTNLCDLFMGSGMCKRGGNCAFAHGRYELRPYDYKGDFEKKIKEMPNWKTTVCQFFIKTGGNCRNGADCDYAHGDKELRTIKQSAFDAPIMANGAVMGKPGMPTAPICKFFGQGNCKSGAACKFSHGSPQPHMPMYTDYTSDVTPATMMATAQSHPVASMMNKDALYSEFMEFLDHKFQGQPSYGMPEPTPQYMTVMPPRARGAILGQGGAAAQSGGMMAKYGGPTPGVPVRTMPPQAAAAAAMVPPPTFGAAANAKGGHARGMAFQNTNQFAQDTIYEELYQ